MAEGADLVEIQSQYAKIGIMQGKMRKSSVGLLVATKALNVAFGPFFKFALKISAGMKGLVGIFKKSKKGTQDNAKAMKGMAESAEVVDGLFKSMKLSMLMTIGGIFAIIAAFGYLTGAFGQFAYEGLGAGDIFGKLKDVIKGVVDYIKGIGERVIPVFKEIGENVMIVAGIILGMDWSPITDMLMLAFGAIGTLIAEFVVTSITFFGELFSIFTTLMTYLADTGALQQIIDIVAIMGTSTILVIGMIFMALDMLGINFGSIFGFMTDVIGGFVSFLIESGLLGFFFDVIYATGLLLAGTALVFAGIIVIIADFLSYFTGPTWQIITSVIGAIVDYIAISLAILIAIIQVAVQLIMLPWRFLFGFLDGGWEGAMKGTKKSTDKIKQIIKSTADAIGSRLESLAGNVLSAIQGAFQFMLAPIRYVVDKVKELIGYLTDLLKIDLGGVTDMLGDLPGAGLIGDTADWLGFATGGVSRGPRSGYTAVLHGTEAVVPLPDGQSIPVDFRGTVEVQQEGGSGMSDLNRTMRQMFTPIANIPQSIKGLFDRPISATLEGEPIAHDIDIRVEHDGESERILMTISGNIERLVKLMAEVPQMITNKVSQSPITINAIPAIRQLIKQLIKPIIAIPQIVGGLFDGRIIPVEVKGGIDSPQLNLIPAVRAINNLSGPINSIPQALASIFYGRVIPVSIRDDLTIGRLLDGRTIPVSIQNSGETNLGENVTFNINVSGGSDASKIAKAVTREIQRAFRTRARSGGYGRGI
jgi:hypothetical protein